MDRLAYRRNGGELKPDDTSVLKLSVFNRGDFAVFGVLSVLQLFLIFEVYAEWFGARDLQAGPFVFWMLTALLTVRILVRLTQWSALPRMRRPGRRAARPGWKVGIATTFVPGLESLEMLEQTVRAIVSIDYPHDTWVLDEGDSDEVREMCRRLGALHFSRKGQARFQTPGGVFASRTKYGNYNAWFHAVGFERYEIVAGFDPDHVPDSAFLEASLGYFDDQRVGYVQLPQTYYNQAASLIARGAAEETYSYYSSTQMAANGGGWPLVTGCHNLHRVEALREIGGFAPHDADDMLITYLYRENDWSGVYVPEIRAWGLTPVNWSGYLSQQLRWSRSVLDIKFRVLPRIRTGLALFDRCLSAVHGLSYLKGLMALVGTLLLIVMLALGRFPFGNIGRPVGMILLLLFVFYAADLYRQRFFLDVRREWGLHWRAGILQYAKWPFLALAVVDVVLRRRTSYTTTLKVAGGARRLVLFWPHAAIVLALVGAWAVGVLNGVQHHPSVLVWGASMAVASLLLIVSEFFEYPPPYERELWDTRFPAGAGYSQRGRR